MLLARLIQIQIQYVFIWVWCLQKDRPRYCWQNLICYCKKSFNVKVLFFLIKVFQQKAIPQLRMFSSFQFFVLSYYVSLHSELCCDVRYDFRIKTMFSSSFPPVVCIYVICVCLGIVVSKHITKNWKEELFYSDHYLLNTVLNFLFDKQSIYTH
jgi:hypothetical protein